MWARATTDIDEERLGMALIAADAEHSLEDEIPHGLVACKMYFEHHSVVVTRPVPMCVAYEDLLNFGLLPTEETGSERNSIALWFADLGPIKFARVCASTCISYR